jgi:transposase
MDMVSTFGLDLAKNVFQVHGADASGKTLWRKKLGRAQVLEFFAAQPICRVAMEPVAVRIARAGRSPNLVTRCD